MELNEIKDIITIAKPFIDPILSTIVAPHVKKLESWLKKRKIDNQVIDNFFENKFEEYLYRTYRKTSFINVLVFPNQQISLKEIYIPLSLQSSKDAKISKIDIFKEEFIKAYNNILISDNAGMGKSTLIKWISLSIIEQSLSIPIIIELKKIKKNHNIISEIFDQLDPIDQMFDRELILKFLELGNFTILFDGFDEVEYDQREFVISDIKNLASKANKNWFILTSRLDPELTSFGEFQLFNINPLQKEESFSLIDKYDIINKNQFAEKLKSEINGNFNQVEEFLTNPFLVSLLYKTYTYNKDIPTKKSTFYEEVYLALYKHHDLSKDGYKRGKKSGLDLHDFRLILRRLAFNTSKVNKLEYTESVLVELLREVKEDLNIYNFKEIDYIEDLEFNVPLFSREGNVLKWLHKSLQDYFSAEFICNYKNKAEILHRIYASEKQTYLLTLEFILELDPLIFSEIITLNILKKFLNYCNKSYKNFELDNEIIEKRKMLTFGILYGVQVATPTSTSNWIKKVNLREKIENNTISLLTVSSYGKNNNLIEIVATSYDQEIINLLGLKKYAFTTSFIPNYEIKKIKLPEIKSTIFLNDTQTNPLNSETQFSMINDKIVNMLDRHKMFFLDLEKSKGEIKSIETYIIRSNENRTLDNI